MQARSPSGGDVARGTTVAGTSSSAASGRSSADGGRASRGSAEALRGLDYDAQVAKLAPNEAPELPMFRGGPRGGEDGTGRGRDAIPRPQERTAPDKAGFGAVCEGAPAADDSGVPTEHDRGEARKVATLYASALTMHRMSIAENYVANLARYTRATGADGGLALARSAFVGLAQKAVIKTAVTAPIKDVSEKGVNAIAAKLTGSTLGTIGKVAHGFVLGLLYDTLVDLIFDPTGKALRAAFRAGVNQGAGMVEEAARAALAGVRGGLGADRVMVDEVHQAISMARSKAGLSGLMDWMRMESGRLAAPVFDTVLYDTLMEMWVLQRAGDEEDGNKHTDPEAYAAAHDKLAPDGNLARRDLFVHQCRFAFGRLGIDAEPMLATWEKRVQREEPTLAPTELIERLGPLHIEVDRFQDPERFIASLKEVMPFERAIALQPESADDPKGAQATLDKLPSGIARSMLAHQTKDAADYTEAFRRSLRTGGVRLRASVKLTDADGAVFVDRFSYRMWGTRHAADGGPGRPQKEPFIQPFSWTESPD